MNVQDWETIDILYQSGSLTKASQLLYISQPALTRRIQQIETEFSTLIIVRTSKGISFTPQGEQLAHYAREMLSRYHEMKQIMAKHDETTGTIRIVSSSTQSQFFLPGLLESYRKKYPYVSFEVETTYSALCIRKLQERAAQIAFIRGDHQMSCVKKKLMTNQAYAVYSRPFTLEELPSLPYVNFEADRSGSSIREDWWFHYYDCAPYTAMTVKNINICYEMVKHGLGFSIFFKSNFWMENEHLYSIPLTYKNGNPVLRNDWICYREETLREESVKKFVEFTDEYVKTMTGK